MATLFTVKLLRRMQIYSCAYKCSICTKEMIMYILVHVVNVYKAAKKLGTAIPFREEDAGEKLKRKYTFQSI